MKQEVGKYYWININSEGSIFYVETIENDGVSFGYYISLSGNCLSHCRICNPKDFEKYSGREATQEEKNHLDACIQKGEFVKMPQIVNTYSIF